MVVYVGGRSRRKVSSKPYLKDWEHGSSDNTLVWQVPGPEFNPQYQNFMQMEIIQ
jgi:hypothetical protein